MKLEEYLQEKLNVSSEEARKITELVHSYKKEYGHDHHNHEKGAQDVYAMISESKEDCVSNDYELDKIHCNGCSNHCILSSPNCGRGRMLQTEFSNMKKN